MGGSGGGPVVTSVYPSWSTTAGGQNIVVAGTGFSGAPTVSFKGVNCTNVVVVSPTKITAKTAAGAAGVGTINVGSAVGPAATYVAGVKQFWQGDALVNNAGVITAAWPSEIGGTALNPINSPVFVASAFGGHNGARINGTTQGFSSAAGIVQAQAFSVYTAHKIITWANNKVVWGATGGTDAAAGGTNGVSPQLGVYAGTGWSGTDGDLAVGTYGVVEWRIDSGGSGGITVNGGSTTVASGGNNPMNGTFYLGQYAAVSFLNCEVVACVITDATENVAQLTAALLVDY
jgi:hypothetical protein